MQKDCPERGEEKRGDTALAPERRRNPRKFQVGEGVKQVFYFEIKLYGKSSACSQAKQVLRSRFFGHIPK